VGFAAYVATKVIGLETISNWIQDNLGGGSSSSSSSSTTTAGSRAQMPMGAPGLQRPRPGPAGPPAQGQWRQPGPQQPGYYQDAQYDEYTRYQQHGPRQGQALPQSPPQQQQQQGFPPAWPPRKRDDVVDVYFEDDWGK
jgi:hypothetical protein